MLTFLPPEIKAVPEQRVDGLYDGRLVGCLQPALHAAGLDWSTEYLMGFLGIAFSLNTPLPHEERTAIQKEAWDMVRQAIDDGYPTVARQVMSLEMKEAPKHRPSTPGQPVAEPSSMPWTPFPTMRISW